MAYSASYRHDGKLVVAGSKNALVQVFDVNSRLVLRTFKGHKDAVQCTHFSSDQLRIISGSDDKSIRLWDMPTSSEVAKLMGHNDYVRCGYESPSDSNLWVSGSYDHTVKYWDLRSNECVMTINHGAPVEAIVPLPGGSLLVSAGKLHISRNELFSFFLLLLPQNRSFWQKCGMPLFASLYIKPLICSQPFMSPPGSWGPHEAHRIAYYSPRFNSRAPRFCSLPCRSCFSSSFSVYTPAFSVSRSFLSFSYRCCPWSHAC